MDIEARARVALAVAARQASDEARYLVGLTADDLPTGYRIEAARRLRALTLAILDRAVLAELAAGTPWPDVADACGLDEDDFRARYTATWDVWALAALDPSPTAHGTGGVLDGTPGDPDVLDTAHALDDWYNRHTDVYDPPATAAVSAALHD